eukprot:CAMPEP_0117473598 /NCGR_PEP_ID=MMETSP0784-20121206/8852_1 /TAXON_ID=39447 /ORGANISM="" /LENGTH=112 /DNA_ID=CAMNT_0005267799 /DNA_START=57 /DNA_END=395 /DNA_ORIENTATION=-
MGGLGVGASALAARTALRALHRSGVKLEIPQMPAFGGFASFRGDSLKGFEAPMTRAEARSILNVREMNPAKDSIREAHRRLLVANHPDKGGSTYIASKINEAKDVLLGKRTS